VTERRNFDTLTPEFRIHVDGRELPPAAKADLQSLSVLEDVDAAGMFTFTLFCWDGANMEVKWIDDDLFKAGNRIEIEMGYRDNMESLFKGEITGLEPEFAEEAPPTLTVMGYDRRHRLMGRRKTRTFLNMKDSDIAAQIAGDWSLTPDVETTRTRHDYVLQHNQTDFDFLQERARRIGFEMLVEDTTLYFRTRQNSGSASVTLNREVELLRFNVRLTTVGQVEEVLVQGWSPKNKEAITARSATGDETRMGGSASGPATAQRAFGNTGDTLAELPVFNQAEADELARGWFGEMALRYVEGRGLCIGRQDLRAGTLVEIEGLGTRFSGTYYVMTTEHTYRPNSGYRTQFTVRRNTT
jgi:phage protein D